ncbi:hypothetical protein BH23ACT2_BH23ACT2_22770 [soil metagenome]
MQTFGLLADRTRLAIVWHLRDGELNVNELAALVDKAPATVSQHLSKLRLARVVLTRRAGTFVYHRLADSHLAEVVEDALFHADHLVQGLADHPPARAREAPGPS